MSMLKSPLSMGVLVTFFYILVTWSLRVQWESNLPSATTLDMSLLLKVLLYPIPMSVSAASGGALPFWPVLLQGIWLGAVIFFGMSNTSKAPKPGTNMHIGREMYVLYAVPFVIALLVGNGIGMSLLFGMLGPIIVGATWYGIMWLSARSNKQG